jgi:acyl carrier protein phosphodiesterase
MNYLAHAFLSGGDANLILGNFIADHLRGNKFEHLHPQIIEGVMLHRQIDSFSDQHPRFRLCKRVFYNGFEKYSGILVDIYFDHFLARDFSEHSSIPLSSFSEEVYDVYLKNRQILPIRSNRFLDYVISNNIYSAYALPNEINKVLFHLSHRISHGVRLDDSRSLFEENEPHLKENFDTFFSDLKKEFLTTN